MKHKIYKYLLRPVLALIITLVILILVVLTVLSFNPEIDGWTLYQALAVPVFLVFILCSLMAKKEIGYFYIET